LINVARLRRNLSGFSLLEVLVAFVILSLVLTMIFRVTSGSLNSIGAADHYAKALLIAESKLALVGSEIPLEMGEVSGSENDDFNWTLSISPFEFSAEEPLAPIQLINPLYQVSLQVSWSQGSKNRSLVINTLRTRDQMDRAQ
jgi:general secretion pathway protein I